MLKDRMRSVSSASGDMPNDSQSVNGSVHNVPCSSSSSYGLVSTTASSNVDPECDSSYVKIAGEAVGITNLSDSCASLVGANVTYVIKEVIEQAKKFAAHGRRKRLVADDFDAALVMKGYPPQFGFYAKDGLPFRCVGSLGRDLFVTDDHEIELSPIVNAPPAKVPLETNLRAHWLVIDGEQPAVPENPTPVIEEEASVSSAGEAPSDADTGAPGILSHSGKALRKTEQVQIKTVTTHALSVEQQIFFKEITEAIMGSDDARRTEALHSLQTDAGLQVLLPRFSLAIAEGVRCNIVQHNLAILIYLMRMIQSLALNPALSLNRCLHELLPSVLSCILSKQLCARPDTDNHWALREFSSRLLATICKAYNINNLRSRVTQVLTRVWRDEQSTLSTLYGSLYALNELGVDTIRAVVIPRAAPLYNEIRKHQTDKGSAAERIAAEKLQSFVTKVLVNYVRTQRPPGLKDVSDYRSTFGGFGDAIFRTISIEVPHPSSSSVMVTTTTSCSNVSLLRGTSPAQRPASDRRPLAGPSTVQQQQRLSIGTKQPTGSPRLVVRQQGSPLVRQQSQQSFVNTGGRLQAANSNSPRPASTTGYYISGANANSTSGSFVVRPGGVKKMIVTTGQRPTSGTGNDGYRNV